MRNIMSRSPFPSCNLLLVSCAASFHVQQKPQLFRCIQFPFDHFYPQLQRGAFNVRDNTRGPQKPLQHVIILTSFGIWGTHVWWIYANLKGLVCVRVLGGGAVWCSLGVAALADTPGVQLKLQRRSRGVWHEEGASGQTKLLSIVSLCLDHSDKIRSTPKKKR